MLVNCVAYQDGRKLADIQKREIRSYLQQRLDEARKQLSAP